VASAPGTQQATARIRFDSWSEFARFMNQDGGSRGLFVRAAVPPPIGTDLTVHFVLPDGSNLALPGRVAHRLSAEEASAMGEHPGMGVQFTHMSEEQAQRIQEIMANVESRQSTRNSSPVAQNNSTAPGVTRPTPVDPVRALQPTPATPIARPAAGAQNGAAAAKPVNGSAAAPAGTKRPTANGAVSGVPHDPRLHQAASLLERGRFDLAERKVAEMLEDNPELIVAKILAHVIDARRLRAQFAFEQAIERYRAVLRLDPEHREATEQLATLPQELEHSIALYQRVFGTKPG
jgi:hypothetical protein